jgi:hypothetical protein
MSRVNDERILRGRLAVTPEPRGGTAFPCTARIDSSPFGQVTDNMGVTPNLLSRVLRVKEKV